MVYFNHKHGCQKCNIVGIHDRASRRVYFADFSATKRTDESFRDRHDQLHHRENSLLEDLTKADGRPMLDMIKHFPTSDPLHLLDEGVMKKCLNIWLNGTTSNRKKKWSKENVDSLNIKILFWNKELPSDFNRKIRILKYIGWWKATEFRTMLLYLGIVAFKDMLAETEYTHFLYLSMAIRLCSCSTYVKEAKFKEIARILLLKYCDNFPKIYGCNEVVSNVHNIVHIIDDVEHLGSLTETSTYPFEHFLGQIKFNVQPSYSSIEQISRRMAEIALESENCPFDLESKFKKSTFEPELKYGWSEQNQYKFHYVRIRRNVFFSSKKISDKWFLTKDNNIVLMKYASIKENSHCIFGAEVQQKRDFFSVPFASSKLNIYVSNGICPHEKFYKCSEIKMKLACFSYKDEYVFMPLLHSIDELN